MNRLVTKGIVLSRLNFGEADRIITLLTPDYGKIRVMAKGVRKIKSKLAGGIELFSESDVTFIRGRGEIGTLISTRLIKNFGHISRDLERTQLAYEFLKYINHIGEDGAGEEYYTLLYAALDSLDRSLPLELLELWFTMQVLKTSGHNPNLRTDAHSKRLDADGSYIFDSESMIFVTGPHGTFRANHIKLLRLAEDMENPDKLLNVQDTNTVLLECLKLARTMRGRFIRV